MEDVRESLGRSIVHHASPTDLPTPESSSLLLERLSNFGSEVQSEIGGAPGHHKFRRSWNGLRNQFKEIVSCMEPKVVLCDEKTERTTIPLCAKRHDTERPIHIDLESGDSDGNEAVPRPRIPEQGGPATLGGTSESPGQASPKFFEEGLGSPTCNHHTITLRGIQDTIQDIS